MGVSLLEQLVAGEAPPLVPLTVEQYHEMIVNRILPEGAPIELIDGLLVRKDRGAQGGNYMSVGPMHVVSIKRLETTVNRRTGDEDCHTRNQAPVTIPDISEPGPDLSLAKGPPEAYGKHHPGPKDLLAIFEVADSSLNFDRTTKQRIYATAGIPTYWIVNLVDNQIEVYAQPAPAEGR